MRSVNDPLLITMAPVASAAEDALLSLPCLASEARDLDPSCASRSTASSKAGRRARLGVVDVAPTLTAPAMTGADGYLAGGFGGAS